MDETNIEIEQEQEQEQEPPEPKTPVIVEDIESISEINLENENVLEDPYDEEESEQRFLHSKPTCFIIFGKPGSGKTAFAKRFAQFWRCEFVNPQSLLNDILKSTDEQSNQLWQILSRGENIPEELVFELLEEKLHSPEVRHHGYILDDYPTICEDFMNLPEQYERMKTWKLTPDFILNLRMPDEDLMYRRVFQRIDPETGTIYTEEVYNFQKKPKKESKPTEEDEEEEVEEEETEEIEEISPEIIKSLLVRPEDMPNQANTSIQMYKSNMLRIMEEFMLNHDQDYIMELDANQPIDYLVQQLIIKLQLFGLSPAAVLQRLYDDDEEEAVEEADVDDLLKSFSTKKTVAGQYPWKKSRWGKNCPVALYEGNIVHGKAEFAVSFLDKIYLLSTSEFMDKFLRNPRPYLLKPNPKPTCKVLVLGLPKSGKTNLCYLLAHKYNAQVIQIEDQLNDKLKQHEEEKINNWTQESTQQAIETVRANLKKRMLMEFKKRLESNPTEKAAEDKQDSELGDLEEKPDEEEKPEAEKPAETEDQEDAETNEPEDTETRETEEEESAEELKQQSTPPADETKPTEEEKPFDESELSPQMKEKLEEALAAIDANHPEVCELVVKLMEAKGKPNVSLTGDEQFAILTENITRAEEINQQKKNSHIKNGGWVLDDNPSNNIVWQVCVEQSWFPDNIFCLVDESKDYTWLMQQWFSYQPKPEPSINEEDPEKASDEEIPEGEQKAKKSVGDIAEDAEMEEITPKGDELEPGEVESKSLIDEEASAETLVTQEAKDPAQTDETQEIESPKKEVEGKVEPSKPVSPLQKAANAYKSGLKKKTGVLNSIISTIASSLNLETFSLDINGLKIEDIFDKTVVEIEKFFQYQPVEYSMAEMEEDDEQFEEEELEDEENEEQEEEEEEENIHHSNKRPLGNTSYYCPVMLTEKGILCSGKPENAVRFENKLYYMSTSDALETFLLNPNMYIPKKSPPKPPPPRISIIGVHGSGKTVYGRYLARKLGVFHICFHEKLQEMILKKVRKKVGPHYGDQASDTASDESEAGDDDHEPETEKVDVSEEASEFGELTEDEEHIKANLEGDTSLPLDLLESIITPWWFQEPYRSTGFILEGFPRNSDEVTAFQEFGLCLDATIILNVEDTDVVSRILPPKLEEWKLKKEKKAERLKKKKEKAKKDRELKMQKRRLELEKELEEKRQAKLARVAEENEMRRKKDKDSTNDSEVEETQPEEYVEEEEEMDIDTLLNEEFQEEEAEEELDEDEDNEEDAYEKILNDITEQFEIEASKIGNTQEGLEDAGIPRITVEAGRKQHIVNYVINRSLRPYVDFRESIFERVYPVSENMARQLLNTGYKQISYLKCSCPVNLYENVQLPSASGSSRNERYPCIYRQHIYYLSSSEAKDKFVKNPLIYLKAKKKPKPVVPLKLAVIGPPKSGKTYISNRFSERYGIERLSPGVVVRRILETQPKSHLAQKIFKYLIRGQLLPDELTIEALEVVLLDANSQIKGYVLDGYPLTLRQMSLMNERKIIPFRVIFLDIDSTEVIERGVIERLSSPPPYIKHDSGPALAMKYKIFQREIEPVLEWYDNNHHNLCKVYAQISKWAIWEEVKKISLVCVSILQNYMLNIKGGKAASLKGMCITLDEFLSRLGDFGQFCPVSLALHEELVDCSKDTSMNLVAEFRGKYYKMANKKNFDLFMEEPENFVPPNAPHSLPPAELLPRRLFSKKDDVHFELKGYCPVTYLEGKCRYEAIVPGKPYFLVSYQQKFYCFASEEQLDKFMRRPTKYWDLTLPHKLPPKLDPMDIFELPHLGFMEQIVVTPLIRALVAVGDFKPKYPFLSPTHSALVYVAYHLKAFNPKNSDYIRKKYLQKLKRFEENCNLIGYLGSHMTSKFVDPGDRSDEFNSKLETFFALKGFEPSLSWIV